VSQTAAVVLAAGAGRRLGSATGKAFVPVGGKPMVSWSLQAFESSPDINRIVLVVSPSDRHLANSLGASKLRVIVDGGETRHDSEFNGLESLAPDIASGVINRLLVHDAARPFVDLALVRRLLEALRDHPGAIAALPAGATLVSRSRAGLLEDFVQGAWAVQTPQAFRAGPLLEAHRRAGADGFRGSDTASVLEHTGQSVAVLDGNPDTFKITTPVDLLRAQVVAKRWPYDAPSRLQSEIPPPR
jgi:2-C-methyl-D-erythritol 4-phosphate cytidylyltransferase